MTPGRAGPQHSASLKLLFRLSKIHGVNELCRTIQRELHTPVADRENTGRTGMSPVLWGASRLGCPQPAIRPLLVDCPAPCGGNPEDVHVLPTCTRSTGTVSLPLAGIRWSAVCTALQAPAGSDLVAISSTSGKGGKFRRGRPKEGANTTVPSERGSSLVREMRRADFHSTGHHQGSQDDRQRPGPGPQAPSKSRMCRRPLFLTDLRAGQEEGAAVCRLLRIPGPDRRGSARCRPDPGGPEQRTVIVARRDPRAAACGPAPRPRHHLFRNTGSPERRSDLPIPGPERLSF